MDNKQNETFSSGLSNAEIERLAILQEEMAESIHVIGKILRHGFDSSHPNNPSKTNRFLLEEKLSHVEYALDMLVGNKDLDPRRINECYVEKSIKIGKYLHHNTVTT